MPHPSSREVTINDISVFSFWGGGFALGAVFLFSKNLEDTLLLQLRKNSFAPLLSSYLPKKCVKGREGDSDF